MQHSPDFVKQKYACLVDPRCKRGLRVKDARTKEKASRFSKEWAYWEGTPPEIIQALRAGMVLTFGRFDKEQESGRYRRVSKLFRGTHFIFADADEFVEAGVEPWTEHERVFEIYPDLRDEVYAVGESVSSMTREKYHRRYRLWFFFDEPIGCVDHYKDVLWQLHEKYPIINPKLSAVQPVMGNARAETCEWREFGNVLSLSDYPKPETAKEARKGKARIPKTARAMRWEGEYDLRVLDFIDPDADYFTWRNVGMAIQDAGLSFQVWDEWSRRGALYTEPDNAKKMEAMWRGFTPGGGISWGTVVHYAKLAGYEPETTVKGRGKDGKHNQVKRRLERIDGYAPEKRTLDDCRDENAAHWDTIGEALVDTEKKKTQVFFVAGFEGLGKSTERHRVIGAKAGELEKKGRRLLSINGTIEERKQDAALASAELGENKVLEWQGRGTGFTDEIKTEHSRVRRESSDPQFGVGVELIEQGVLCPVADKVEEYQKRGVPGWAVCEACDLKSACKANGWLSQFDKLPETQYLSLSYPNALSLTGGGFIKKVSDRGDGVFDTVIFDDATEDNFRQKHGVSLKLLKKTAKRYREFGKDLERDRYFRERFGDKYEAKAFKQAGDFLEAVLEVAKGIADGKKEGAEKEAEARAVAYWMFKGLLEGHEDSEPVIEIDGVERVDMFTESEIAEIKKVLRCVWFNGEPYEPEDILSKKRGYGRLQPEQIQPNADGLVEALLRMVSDYVPENCGVDVTEIERDEDGALIGGKLSIPYKTRLSDAGIKKMGVISASTDPDTVQRLIADPDVEFVNFRVKEPSELAAGSKVFQYADAALASQSIFDYVDGKAVAIKETARVHIRFLCRVVQNFLDENPGAKAGIGTHKELVDDTNETFKDDPDVKLIRETFKGEGARVNYGQERGRNLECDIFVVFGLKRFRDEVRRQNARATHSEDTEAIPSGDYGEETEFKRVQRYGMEVGRNVYTDERLEHARQQDVGAAMRQMAGRARVFSKENRILIVHTNEPMPMSWHGVLYERTERDCEHLRDVEEAVQAREEAEAEAKAKSETEAERDAKILELRAEGMSYRKIADAVGDISEGTVRYRIGCVNNSHFLKGHSFKKVELFTQQTENSTVSGVHEGDFSKSEGDFSGSKQGDFSKSEGDFSEKSPCGTGKNGGAIESSYGKVGSDILQILGSGSGRKRNRLIEEVQELQRGESRKVSTAGSIIKRLGVMKKAGLVVSDAGTYSLPEMNGTGPEVDPEAASVSEPAAVAMEAVEDGRGVSSVKATFSVRVVAESDAPVLTPERFEALIAKSPRLRALYLAVRNASPRVAKNEPAGVMPVRILRKPPASVEVEPEAEAVEMVPVSYEVSLERLERYAAVCGEFGESRGIDAFKRAAVVMDVVVHYGGAVQCGGAPERKAFYECIKGVMECYGSASMEAVNMVCKAMSVYKDDVIDGFSGFVPALRGLVDSENPENCGVDDRGVLRVQYSVPKRTR